MTNEANVEPTESPKDSLTGADVTMAAIRQLAGAKGVRLPDDEPEGDGPPLDGGQPGDTEGEPAPAGGEPEPAAAQAKDPKEPTKDPKELLGRLAQKDLKYQQARNENAQLRQRLEQLEQSQRSMLEDFRSNAVGALHKHFGLTTTDINKRVLDLDAGPQATPAEDMPGWAKQLKDQNDKLEQQLRAYQEREQQTQQQTARQREIAQVADFLGSREDLPVLNELGRHDLVYERVLKHIGQHGSFESEREAAEIVSQYALEAEEQLRSELLGYTAEKPRIKAWLLEKLGAQNAAKPARQETRAPNGRRNGAAPAVPNSLTTQRATKANTPPLGWGQEPYDDVLRRTAEEMVVR